MFSSGLRRAVSVAICLISCALLFSCSGRSFRDHSKTELFDSNSNSTEITLLKDETVAVYANCAGSVGGLELKTLSKGAFRLSVYKDKGDLITSTAARPIAERSVSLTEKDTLCSVFFNGLGSGGFYFVITAESETLTIPEYASVSAECKDKIQYYQNGYLRNNGVPAIAVLFDSGVGITEGK